MHRLLTHLATAALLTLAGLTASPEAKATTIAPLSIEQYVDASTYVVRGQVLDQWTTLDDLGTVWTHTRVSVDALFKGATTPDQIVVTTMGGVYGDTILDVPGRAVYSPGERVLLFLYEDTEAGRIVTVGMWTGKYTIRRAPGETRRHLMRLEAKNVEVAYDHRFLPHPPAAQRVFLDDIVDRIEARLTDGWDGKPIPGLAEEDLRRINTPRARRIER